MEHVSEPRGEEPKRRRPASDDPGHADAARPTSKRVSRGALPGLQRQAGNRAVSRLIAQRNTAVAPAAPKAATTAGTAGAAAASPGLSVAGPAEADAAIVQRAADMLARPGPSADPRFSALKRDVRSKQQILGKHPPPRSEASAAQGAAKPPQDDKQAQGKAANAEKMNAAKPGEFNKAAFIAAVNAAIAKQTPKNLEDADKFGTSGKADAVKGEVAGKVGDGKKAAAGVIESTTKAPPDTGAAKDKQVTPLKPDQPPGKPGTPDPNRAVPDKAPPAATDFSAGPKQVNTEMADAGVTEEQLARSNEPEFTGALQEKKAGEAHAATAPGEVRASEAKTLAGAKAEAQQAGATAMTGMAAARAKSGKEVDAGKGGAQSEEEKKRAHVTAKLQTVFDATKKDVEDILTGLDTKVDDKFTKDEKTARDAFTADHKRRMDAYKDKRYSGWTGGLKWAKDKLMGMPEEANQIFVVARQGYVTAMQQVISGVADLIGAELNRAKARVAKGRADLKAEVDKLPKDLQQIGKEAAGDFAGKFDELTQSVDDKGSELVDTLASKYTEALKSVDEEIAAEKEKNKGLVAKAIDAVKGVIETIKNLASLLMGVLAKAAQAVSAIIKDPIGFLGHLVSAVGAGLRAFMANIGAHLKKGLVSWLLGTAAKAGLQLPERFDLRGILQLIASLLGLTWGAIRGRIVAKGVPEQAMGAVEAGVPLVGKIQSGGVAGLWEDIKDKIGDLKETLLGKISEYLIPTILMAGITWVISLLNPASAFIKACKMIIDIITFIVTRGAQILEFVNAVLDAVIAIAGGGAGGVPGLIENALAKSIPVLIGFLAALLGIGGVADKVKKIFQALSKPVMKAVDWVVGKIAALGKKIWARLKGKATGADQTPAQKQRRLDQGMAAAMSVINRFSGRTVGDRLLKPLLMAVRTRYRMTSLTLLNENGKWAVEGVVNPSKKQVGGANAASQAGLDGLHRMHQVARNRIKNDLKKVWNNNSVRKKLAADPTLRAGLEREFNRLTNAMGGKTEDAFEALMAGRDTRADVQKMFNMYRAHISAADSLIERLQDVTKTEAQLGAEGERVKADIVKLRRETAGIIAAPDVQAVLALPSFSSLKGRLNTRATVIDTAIGKLSEKTLSELRADASTARKLRDDATDARSLAKVSQSIEPPLKKINDICLNTTKEGKEDANEGDGSSEAAAKKEARTGEPIKGKAHGPKCKMEAKGLRDAVRILRDLRKLTTEASVLTRIDEAVTRAEGRATSLDTGASKWDRRVADDPDGLVWDRAGVSKIKPPFGKGI